MKSIKEYCINEGKDIRWYPEDHNIKKDEDAIDMIAELFSASTAPEILADAFEDGNFDFHCFLNDKWLKALGKALGDAVNKKYEELYG